MRCHTLFAGVHTLMITYSRLLRAAFLFLILASALSALTPPALQMTDAAGNTVTVDLTGIVTFSGSCTPLTCSTSPAPVGQAPYPQVSPTLIAWGGTVGAFSVTLSVGQTNASPAYLGLNLQALSTGSHWRHSHCPVDECRILQCRSHSDSGEQ